MQQLKSSEETNHVSSNSVYLWDSHLINGWLFGLKDQKSQLVSDDVMNKRQAFKEDGTQMSARWQLFKCDFILCPRKNARFSTWGCLTSVFD